MARPSWRRSTASLTAAVLAATGLAGLTGLSAVATAKPAVSPGASAYQSFTTRAKTIEGDP